ncbi:MAG: hypothetical protein HZA53_02415 [Planctomycetes bacterium]|nr:hypothetical protein [Planctomycetota bacterium]
MLALITTLPLLLPQWFGARPLQPYEAHSASGAWTLEVKPSDPSGKGPMRARILHGKDVSWSGEFAWTFEHAGLSEDGTCVGYANLDKLRIAVLGADGALKKQYAIEHTASLMHGPDLPYANGPVLVHPTADLALIRVELPDQVSPVLWRALRLSTGEATSDIAPTPPPSILDERVGRGVEARVVGDTQLTLQRWPVWNFHQKDRQGWTQGSVYALHDLEGRIVWGLSLHDDETDPAGWERTLELEGALDGAPRILACGPGHGFTLWHVRSRLRVDYGVERDASAADGWRVVELARRPFQGPLVDADPIAPIRLESLPVVPIGMPPRSSSDCELDVLGRVLIAESWRNRVLVHDANGRRLAVCKLARDEAMNQAVAGGFHGAPDGSVWMEAAQGMAHFDANGARMVTLDTEVSERSRRGVTIYDPLAGFPGMREFLALRSRPDGSALDCVLARAIGADGVRFVLEAPDRPYNPARLHRYASSDAKAASALLPGRPRWSQVSVGPRWVAVGSDEPEVILVRRADSALFRCAFERDDEKEKADWRLGQTPDGSAFLRLNADRARLHRYVLP